MDGENAAIRRFLRLEPMLLSMLRKTMRSSGTTRRQSMSGGRLVSILVRVQKTDCRLSLCGAQTDVYACTSLRSRRGKSYTVRSTLASISTSLTPIRNFTACSAGVPYAMYCNGLSRVGRGSYHQGSSIALHAWKGVGTMTALKYWDGSNWVTIGSIPGQAGVLATQRKTPLLVEHLATSRPHRASLYDKPLADASKQPIEITLHARRGLLLGGRRSRRADDQD